MPRGRISGMVAIGFALVALQADGFRPNAKLGEPYLLGGKSRIIGSNEVIDDGSERWVTLKSVQVTQFFAAKRRTFLAEAGQKLFLLHATLKNPSKVVDNIGPGRTFGLRINDPAAKPSDYYYLGAVNASLDEITKSLKQNESADVIVVLRAPAVSTTLRLGLFYDQRTKSNTRWYDLTGKVEKSTSAYCKGGLVFAESAICEKDKWINFDWVELSVGGVTPISGDHAYSVKVQVANKGYLPAKWGWQYATAELGAESGPAIAYYPDLVDSSTGKSWSGDIPPGQTITVEYRFHPGRAIKAKSFTLRSAATKRALTVTF